MGISSVNQTHKGALQEVICAVKFYVSSMTQLPRGRTESVGRKVFLCHTWPGRFLWGGDWRGLFAAFKALRKHRDWEILPVVSKNHTFPSASSPSAYPLTSTPRDLQVLAAEFSGFLVASVARKPLSYTSTALCALRVQGSSRTLPSSLMLADFNLQSAALVGHIPVPWKPQERQQWVSTPQHSNPGSALENKRLKWKLCEFWLGNETKVFLCPWGRNSIVWSHMTSDWPWKLQIPMTPERERSDEMDFPKLRGAFHRGSRPLQCEFLFW